MFCIKTGAFVEGGTWRKYRSIPSPTRWGFPR